VNNFHFGMTAVVISVPAYFSAIMQNITTKNRPDDVLGSLSQKDQDQILDWLDVMPIRKVQEKVEAAPPDGLDCPLNH
jgi:hypothetical protein